MTDDALDLDAIEARANAASPGPWHANGDIVQLDTGCREDMNLDQILCDKNVLAVCRFGKCNDANFIRAARDDIPALIARIRELEAERNAARVALGASILGYEELLAGTSPDTDEGFAATVAAYGMPEDAIKSFWFIGQGLTLAHNGDCTNEPQTCMRCLAERTMHRVDEIIKE